jgi:hypothetical protein
MIVGVGFGLRQGCITIEEHSAGQDRAREMESLIRP